MSNAEVDIYRGKVDSITSEGAHVTIVGPDGERTSGLYPLNDLMTNGVRVGDRFVLVVSIDGDLVSFKIESALLRHTSTDRSASTRLDAK